jgi:hypothetical protein
MSKSSLKAVDPDAKKSILGQLSSLPPADTSPLFKFEHEGDWIYAKFKGRRTGVQTQTVAEPSTVLDCEILHSVVDGEEGPTGLQGIFESTRISQIMDANKLAADDSFYLRFDSVKKNRKGKSKEFSFTKLTVEQCVELEKEIDAA